MAGLVRPSARPPNQKLASSQYVAPNYNEEEEDVGDGISDTDSDEDAIVARVFEMPPNFEFIDKPVSYLIARRGY